MKYLQYILLFLIVSCSDTKKNSSTSEVDISLKSFNSDLTVGSTTYTGPEKINYLLEIKRHGGIDLSKPSKYGTYPSDIYDKALAAMKRRNQSRFSAASRELTPQFTNYAETNAVFQSRGPGNMPGRSLAGIVDSRDETNKTWLIGTVGGGILKTTDSGVTFEEITSELKNSYISTIEQSKSNPNIFYVGTGNSWQYEEAGQYGGSVYRSIDGGVTWDNISLKDSLGNIDFRFRSISDIVIDEEDPDVISVSIWPGGWYTNSPGSGFIYRSEDAGKSWNLKYTSEQLERITQLQPSPTDPKIIYASVSRKGVIKSIDGGKSWFNPGNIGLAGVISYDNESGIYNQSGDSNFGRVSVSISHKNPNTLYLGAYSEFPVNGGPTTQFSKLYVSHDGGISWNLIKNKDNTEDDWLNGLGYFANSIMIHPFNDSVVYHASQDMQRSTLLPDPGVSFNGSSTIVKTDNISSNINILNIWGGSALGSGSEWSDNSYNPDFDDIEIRFGPGKTQKAYRFSVPEGSTSGVPHANYTYQGITDVPFEVWNNSLEPPQQITVSFRDNYNDGSFNLLSEFGESREYIIPQNIPYDPTMSQSEITQENGQLYKSTFLIWLYLAEGVTWNPDSLPNSSLKIETLDVSYYTYKKETIDITDYYGSNDINQNVHVDHHFFKPIVNEQDTTFSFILGHDGGISVSKTKSNPGVVDDDFYNAGQVGDSWYVPSSGFNTSLLWGADKVKGREQYLVGAQDHGSFLSNKNFVGSDTSNYTQFWSGDGFEILAHNSDPDKMFGGSQFNSAVRSTDGGDSWSFVSNMPAFQSLNAPFSSQYESSYQDPDLILSLNSTGVGKSTDWGDTWINVEVPDGNWANINSRDISVSDANPRYIWVGGYMGNLSQIYVSDDWGNSYNPVNNFTNENGLAMGTISGIYTHPYEDSSAYVLFSYYGFPKVIKTEDLGNTWEDISGFASLDEGISVSSTGFPNVGVYSLLVMPHNNDIIWVGTDIGLIESTDGGKSWYLVESNMPFTAIYDLKVKDQGQVIITTHGAGLWTATIEDLKSFIPKPATLPPVIDDAYQVSNENEYIINTTINFKSAYDSLSIQANETVYITITDSINIETSDIVFNVLDKGDYTLQAFGYKDGIAYPSNEFDITLNPTLAPRTEYSTTFSDLVGDEFGLDRFRIGSQGGFQGRQLHTEHPYESGVAGGYDDGYSVHALLNIPIIITDYTPSIRFKEIVLVEPGEPGTSFGDWNFWDYVIVEASKDGVYWRRLIDGYDSDADPAWRTAYNIGEFGSPDLIRDRQINFSPHFSVGDTVKVRFRMFSDDLTVSWGWMVDDLYIQKDLPVVQGIEFTELDKDISIYPNPTSGEFSIDFNDTWQGDVNCRITDIFGRNIYTNTLDNKSSNSSHKIDIRDSNDGMYIIQLVQGEKKTMKKIIKE